MKKIILGSLSILLAGCVVYPENYTYSPSVTTHGNSSPVGISSPMGENGQPFYNCYGNYNSIPYETVVFVSPQPVW